MFNTGIQYGPTDATIEHNNIIGTWTNEILVTYSAIEAEEGNIEEAKEIWERVEKTGLKLVQLKSYRKGTFFEKIKPHLEPLGLLQSLKWKINSNISRKW